MMPSNENARRQPGADTSNNSTNHTAGAGIKQYAKRLIVGVALWGLLPVRMAEWLMRRGGLRHE